MEEVPFLTEDRGHAPYLRLTLGKLVHNYRNEGFFLQNLWSKCFSLFSDRPPRDFKLFGGIFEEGPVFGQILQQGVTSSLTSLTG